MWLYRKMVRILWADKKKHDEFVLNKAKVKRELVIRINSEQPTFFGHVFRSTLLECLVQYLTGVSCEVPYRSVL